MKTKGFLAVLLCTLGTLLSGRAMAEGLPLLPKAATQQPMGTGCYVMPQKVTVSVERTVADSVLPVAQRFGAALTETTGRRVAVKTAKTGRQPSAGSIVLKHAADLPAEGYTLDVAQDGIVIRAAQAAGFFYALQTLRQLCSPAVAAGCGGTKGEAIRIPTRHIADAPRYAWRGFMLDEGRHFFGKEEVKRVLDAMALLKMNRFHWHLTEDQGWRVEIKKYPRLTEVGAWRTSRTLPWGDVAADTLRYGGYYTQADIREIVAYARERFIEIVPEVDLPGHSQAAVAAYPDLLACTPGPHTVWVGQGVSADVVNVASPGAQQFVRDVYDELVELFPFGYIHFGGDECPTALWQQNAACQALLRTLGSENYRDLQTHFYAQLQDYIDTLPREKRRRLIFWNEVLHGNTQSLRDITIMAWIGAEGAAREAARRGFDVILSPQIPYYINRRQSRRADEPKTQGYGDETLERVYAYAPAQGADSTQQRHYLGVQANFWTEWVADADTLEYLMLPRLAAVAEAAWAKDTRKDYTDFLERVRRQTEVYRLGGYDYGRAALEP